MQLDVIISRLSLIVYSVWRFRFPGFRGALRGQNHQQNCQARNGVLGDDGHLLRRLPLGEVFRDELKNRSVKKSSGGYHQRYQWRYDETMSTSFRTSSYTPYWFSSLDAGLREDRYDYIVGLTSLFGPSTSKMAIKTIIVVIGCLLSCADASPVPSKKVKDEYADAKVVYDQRQEGEWNVRAHLDNFVIMIIPTQASPSSPSSSPSLLDLLTKSVPHSKRTKQASKQKTPDAAIETMHFIESKTAPYHVDLTKDTTEGVGGSLAQSGGRRARQVVLAFPVGEDEYVITKSKKGVGKKGKGGLVLLGAGVEQCGPGMARDSYGICRVYKKY